MSKKRDRTRRPRPDGPEPDPAATGSMEVQFSQPAMPAMKPELSGSLDVQFSQPMLPASPASSDGAETSGSLDVQFSQPQMPAARVEPPRPRRPRSKTVPGMIAESLSNLPVVKEVLPKTRKARVLLRSMIVAFGLIAIWIGVIVYLQTRAEAKPDFRPQVEEILIEMREGRAGDVYDHSSTRFQELVLEDTFIAQVEDMNRALGRFVEVASIYKTNVYRGPSGRTARVELLLVFENEDDQEAHDVRGSMSFHREGGEWKMLGFMAELPEEVVKDETSEIARQKRSEAPKEIEALADQILQLSRDDRSEEIWDNASDVFKQSVSREDFLLLEDRRREALGPYIRILKVYSSTINPARTGTQIDALLEFNKGPSTITISANFKFTLVAGQWKLSFYKLILPMPRGKSEE